VRYGRAARASGHSFQWGTVLAPQYLRLAPHELKAAIRLPSPRKIESLNVNAAGSAAFPLNNDESKDSLLHFVAEDVDDRLVWNENKSRITISSSLCRIQKISFLRMR